MSSEDPSQSGSGEILLYTTEDGTTRIECRFEDETIWLSQGLMADLFQTSKQNISLHLRNLFKEKELEEESVVKESLTTATDGKSYRTLFYNLDAIIAVGFRVRSNRGVRFRQWATERLREYMVKGFVMDDERLKNPPGPGIPDYFDELLERIRDIRASGARVYLRIREILALAADYEPSAKETVELFQTVQNKLHFAVTGKTAPELIAERADASKPNMGLTSWKGDVVRKADVAIAKNYLHEGEIRELNRIVVMFLDFAEDQAERKKQIFLKDWRERLNSFLEFNERQVLPDLGTMSRDRAERLAHGQYETFLERRLDAQESENLKRIEETALRKKKGNTSSEGKSKGNNKKK